MKRKLAWVCLLVSPPVLGVAAFCFSDRDPLTKLNFDTIRKGMTLSEVVAILGKENLSREHVLSKEDDPAFVWAGSRAWIVLYCHPSEERRAKDIPRWPIDDNYLAFWGDIMFVDGAEFLSLQPDSFLERIRNWLNL